MLAGGQSLIPMLSMRLAVFEHLVDIGRIGELKGIEADGQSVLVRAGTTEAAVERSEEVRRLVPLLARATPLIGHFQIRNRGTLGGSIVHADPAAEYPAVALTLGAELEVVSTRGSRMASASRFFTGLWSVDLQADELLGAVRFPIWEGRCGFGVREFARRSGDFAIAGATVAVEVDSAERVKRCAIGLIGLGSTPLRATKAERAATGQGALELSARELGHLAVDDLEEVPSELHGSAGYRRRVGAVMVARAWSDAIREAVGEAR